MHEIKKIDLIEAEEVFINKLLSSLEPVIFSIRNHDGETTIADILYHFPSTLGAIIEADGGVDALDKDRVDVDSKLAIARLEYKNSITELKRNLNIVKESSVILDIISRLILGRTSEYSQEVTQLRQELATAAIELNNCVAEGEKYVNEVNKYPNPLNRAISEKI